MAALDYNTEKSTYFEYEPAQISNSHNLAEFPLFESNL